MSTPTVSRTEQVHPDHAELDSYPTQQLVRALVDDQVHAVAAVQAAAGSLAQAIDAAADRLERGGRLLYVGAGTSGRLGLLDSVELLPTFSWPFERALSAIAGGDSALFKAVEGAEDRAELGREDIERFQATADDVLIATAASGSTPYALGAVEAARERGALSIGITNNPGAPLAAAADIGIVLDTGPEVISGSTRLKAGTAQKIALNALSSGIMVRLHKVYGNLMVDVQATNAKLVRRSIRLTQLATGATDAQAEAALHAANKSVKTAIVMLRANCDVARARAALDARAGSIRAALADLGIHA
jgi:N-acetylmuramic acid 6-phosphate etherase